jgi:hypothetical protein
MIIPESSLSHKGRPKAKIQKLGIYFAPSASFKSSAAIKSDGLEDDFLPSGVPQAINLFQPFANDPALGGLTPKLSALRLSRARPITPPTVKQLSRALKNGPRRLFRAAPSFLWRVRFAKSPSSSQPHTTIASLDIEITPFAASDVSIKRMDLELSSGRVEAIGPPLPLQSRPGDQLTLLFKLIPDTPDSFGYTSGLVQHLTVKGYASVLVAEDCLPEIKIDWTTPVDLPSSRPNSSAGKIPPKPLNPDSLPIIDQFIPSDSSNTVANGVCFTISGPPEVQVGEIFKWSLFVINRSDKTHRLAVLAMPKRKPISRRHSHIDSVSPVVGVQPEKNRHALAEPVMDDKMIYTSQRVGVMEPAELICLSSDVRIG